MPKGGFGNLIALPLQKAPRENGYSVFVDIELRPYADQWAFLATVERMAPHDIEPTILRATGGAHPLDVTFIDDEDLSTPWKRPPAQGKRLTGKMPTALTLTVANMIYFDKAQLPQALANRLIRLAAFQNPEFYRAQAMRMSVWDKPRVIGCAENYPETHRAAAWLSRASHKNCCGTTVSDAKCVTSGSSVTRSKSLLLAHCARTRNRPLRRCSDTIPAYYAHRLPSARR